MRLMPVVFAIVAAYFAPSTVEKGPAAGGLVLLEEYKFAAVETEVAGISPHPTDDRLFVVAANRRPVYRTGQKAIVPEAYRGRLLTVNRHTGAVVRAIELPGVNYGGVKFGAGALFVSSLEPPEILKLDFDTGRVLKRFPLPGPAGGLEYDARHGRLLAQLYTGFPHLAVVDAETGAIVDTLWSDESAMDLAIVDGDLLCTWESSFDQHAFGELRRIDPTTGKVIGRMPLRRVHSSMAPLIADVNGASGFISLVRTDEAAGTVAIVKYAYDRSKASW